LDSGKAGYSSNTCGGTSCSCSKKVVAEAGQSPEPLKIIDVGGGNAALGQLIVEYAREQGYSVEYVVVDTDKEIVEAAQSHFGEKFPELKFFHGTGSDYACEMYQDQEPLASYVREKQELSHFHNRRLRDVSAILKSLEGSGEGWLDAFYDVVAILKRDFQLNIDLDGVDIPRMGVYTCQEAVRNQIFLPAQSEVAELTEKI